VKTTGERPHLQRGLPGHGVSPSGWLQTELAIGYQVHIPLHCSQKRQKHPARLPSGSKAGLRSPAHKSQAAIPSQAGTSCEAGASTARSRDGQPSPSGIRGQWAKRTGGVDTSFLAVPAPRRIPSNPSGIHPHNHTPSRQQQPSSQQETSVQPVLTLSRSRRPVQPSQPSLALWSPAHPPAAVPR